MDIKRVIAGLTFSLLMVNSATVGAFMLHDSYSCEVKSAQQVGEDGSLVPDEFRKRLYINSKFVIDRHTGRMLGKPKNYSGLDQPEIMDKGSEEQSLKVITIYGPHVYIDYLIVEIYVDALKKPFMFISSSTIYTGLCKGL